MKRLILTAATLFTLTATAHAFGDMIVQEAPKSANVGSYFIENVPDRKITEALRLLQDNSWSCYKPNVKASRR